MVEDLTRPKNPSSGVCLVRPRRETDAEDVSPQPRWWVFCMPLKNYLKYYWLDNYLGKEVQPSFVDKGFLTAEEFFAIVEWKVPRFGKTKLSYLNSADIKKLTKRIYEASSSKERLQILLKDDDGKGRKGVRLAMASAILTVLYPEELTVYDIRVRKQLRKRGLWQEDPDDITNDKYAIDKYLEEYLPRVRKLAQENNLSLRDCDRALWSEDWREDLQKFLK